MGPKIRQKGTEVVDKYDVIKKMHRLNVNPTLVTHYLCDHGQITEPHEIQCTLLENGSKCSLPCQGLVRLQCNQFYVKQERQLWLSSWASQAM